MEIEIGEIIIDEELEIGDIELDIVKIEPEYKQLEITPSVKEQNFEGSYNKVTVSGDSDLIPENIKKDVEVFGVIGTMEAKGEENAVIDSSLIPTNTGDISYGLKQMLTKIPLIDISKWTSTRYLFQYCWNLTEIPLLDTSNVTDMESTFYDCENLIEIPLLDTSNVTDMGSMFRGCKNLTEIPLLDTSNVTDMSSIFRGCKNLTEIPLLDTSSAIYMSYMFYDCENLIEIPLLDTSNVTDMGSMFRGCKNLTEIPLLDTSNVISMSNMFYNCENLTKIPLLDTSSVRHITTMLDGCRNLINIDGFKDLGKAYIQKTANYNGCRLNLSSCTNLTHESLMNVINNLYDLNLTYDVANGGTLYTQTLQLGSTLKAKLTAEEIVIATNKRLDSFIEGGKEMIFFRYTSPRMIVASEGKHIREKNDVYVAEHTDEQGNIVPEHKPYYTTTVFVPDSFDEDQMNELYVEEDKI